MARVRATVSARAFVSGSIDVEVEDPDNADEIREAVLEQGGDILWKYEGLDDTADPGIDVDDVEVLARDEERPQWAHDCDDCVFLGQHDDVDLYYCEAKGPGITLIARHSDEPSDYNSGLCFISSIPVITEAARRAVAKGLLHKHTPTGKCGGETVEQALANAVDA